MARPGFLTHPKFLRLCHLLGGNDALALGSLELLWETAYQRGDPVIGDATDVELVARWRGNAGELCAALLRCRLIDETILPAGSHSPDENLSSGDAPGAAAGNGARNAGRAIYSIHDLFDHAPEYVVTRQAREEERKKLKTCEHCGSGYKSADHKSRFCSDRCRNQHWKATQGNAGQRTATDAERTATHGNGTPAPAPAPAPTNKDKATPLPPPPTEPASPSSALRPTLAAAEFLAVWNAAADEAGWTRCRHLSAKRVKALRARHGDAFWAGHWREAVERAKPIPGLRGSNDRDWRANVDWFLRPDTVTKILEGSYDGWQPSRDRSRAGASTEYAKRTLGGIL